MTKHTPPNHPNSNFWFGFSVGTLTLAGLAYFLATEKGREKLKQIIEYAETVDMPEELFQILPAIKEALLQVEGTTVAPHHTSIDSLLQKVKTSAEEMKTHKKFIVKK